jgi:isocitrate dehydrogenase (NAD+)
MGIPATLIPGDGIGPEIMDSVRQVLGALGAPFDWDVQLAGVSAIAAAGDPLPEATLASIRRTKLALKGTWNCAANFTFSQMYVRRKR